MKKFIILVGILSLPFLGKAQWAVNSTTYSFRNKLTINGSQVCGPLSNFTILVQLTTNKLKVTGSGGLVNNANGYDIVFTAADGTTKLDHQIDHYTGTTGDYGAWVRIPTLLAGAGNNTDIYMYYGSGTVSTDPSLTTTWDANFKTIYHFQNNNFNDATSNAINSTNNGTTNLAGAWIGDARAFNSASAQFIQSSSTELKTDNNFTVSAWFKATTTAASHILWQGENVTSLNGWGSNTTSGESEMNLSLGDCCDVAGGVTLPNKASWFLGDREEEADANVMDVNTAFTDITSWHHIVGTISNMSGGPTATLYLDGALIGTNSGIAEAVNSATDRSTWAASLLIGKPIANSRYFNGDIDEVRISNIARPANWVCTEFNNQNSTGTFYNFANRPPDLNGIEGTAINYTEDDAATAITSSITAADWDNNTFSSATVSITSGFAASEDLLSFTNAFGITFGSYSGGVLTLNGPASIANFVSALKSVTYTNTNNGNPSTTTRTISFQVNDGTAASNIVTRNITIALRNDAPVLAGANSFTSINQDNFTSGGTLVSALISGQVTDADGGGALAGIAINNAVTTNGAWQYTTNGGTLWNNFGTPINGPNSLLLASNASTLIRFVPNAGWVGTASITFRAWDQTSGSAGSTANTGGASNGGITAFSSSTATASISVYPLAPTGSAAQSFCSIGNPTVSNLTATGTAIKWYSASTGGSALATTTALTTSTTYYATQTVSGLESTSRFAVAVTVVTTPAAPTGTAAQSFCAISTPTVANLTATGGAPIQWYSASSGGVALASTTVLSATTYYASQTVGGCEGTSRFAVTVSLTNPAAPTGTAAQSFCAISTPTVANLTATGGAPIQWYSASSGGVALASTTVLSATTYYASQTVGGCEGTSRFAVTVSLTNPAAPTGTAAQSFCAISTPTVANLTATGGAPIQWYSASSGGVALASTTVLSATTYYASQTVGGCEGTSRFAVTVSLTNPAAPTGTAAQSFCAISTPTVANLTATGGAPIQWYSASSGGVALASTTVLSATTYYASQTVGGCEGTSRFAVTVSLTNPAAPTGTAAQSFCAISTPTVANLTATGGAPIQWYSASSGGVALASTTVLSATTYYASQTVGGCEGTSRFAVTVSLTNPAAPTGTAAQSFCAISTPTVANLTATGGAPIQWYSASSGGVALASTTVLSATTYYASQTVGGCEGTSRFAVTVSLTNPAAPTGTAAQSFCAISTPTVANLTATGGAPIQWYSASSGGVALASTTVLSATTYYASQTVGGCEGTSRFAVTVSLTNPAAPTGTAAQSFCAISTPTVANLTATGGAPIQWYSASSGGVALASTTVLSATTYYASQTVGGCEGTSRFAVTVSLTNPAAPTGTAAQSFCAISTPTVANLTATGGAPIQWYSASSGGVALASTTVLSATTYYASQTVGGCEGTSRFAVTVSLTNPAAPTGTAAQSFCAISTPTVANLTATGGAPIQWYSASSGGVALASTTVLSATTYYASQTVGGCEGTSRFAVTVSLTNPAAPTGTAAQSFCAISTPTVANLTATGGAPIQWYSASSGGVALASTTVLAATTYYASQTVGGCEGTSRFAVTVSLTNPAAPTGTAAQSFCAISTPTVANLTATGGAPIQWYSASSGGVALASTTVLSATTYYASQTVGGCEGTSRFAVTVSLTNPAAPTGTAAQSFCAISTPTVANLTATGGAPIQWYSASSGGVALASTTVLSATTYYASQTVGGCEGTSRFAVTVSLTNPAAPTGTAAQSFCAISTPTVANLTATGGAPIQWYSASSGGVALASTTALATATTYYASQTVGSCESATRFAVTVTISNPAAPTGTAAQSFCTINSPTVANLTATGTTIQWYSASSGGSALATTTALATATTYYASQTVGSCESATRFAVTVTINNPAAPTGTAAQSFCTINSPTVANLTATGTTIQWYSASSGGSALATTTALATATTYYASQTVGSCESATRFAVTVTINNPAAPTGTAAQSFCTINSPTVANLTATGTTIQWYSASSGGSALATTTALATATTYYASQTVGSCESATRFAVTVTISNPAAPTGTAAQSFCTINSPTVANLTATGTTIQWYSASSGGSALATTTALATATTYYATQTVGSCESATRFAVAVTINNPSAPTGTAAQSFCTINSPTVANLTATGTTIQWYSASSGGSALATTTALATATTYYASQTVGSCESATRFAVTVTISNPAAPTGTAAQSFNSNNNPSIADLIAIGGAIKWYAVSTGGVALASNTVLTNLTTYYASLTIGGCESISRFAVTITINNPPTDIALTPSSVDENQPSNTSVGSFSSSDLDAGDTFTYTLVAGAGSTDNVSFTIAGSVLKTTTVFDFETKSSYSIRVRSTDASGLFFEKAFTITINNVNEAPLASDDNVTTNEDTPANITILSNDSGVNNALVPASVVIVSSALHGILTVNSGTGAVTYVPAAGYIGSDSFTYTIEDAAGLVSNIATVTILITPPKKAPIAVDDGPIIIENTKPVIIDVLLNDSDPDGPISDLTIVSVSSATWGSVAVENGKIVYQSYKNVSSIDSFTYIIQDATGLTDTAVVTIRYEYMELQVSQGFSPNGDSNNDTWYIKSIENYPNNSVKVFDRWGMMVYEARSYNNSQGWDGHANTGQHSGKMLEVDTYYYVLNLGDKNLSGFLTLVR